jgi:hypothetical protein
MKNGLIVDTCGTKKYYLNDELHREGNLPAVECINGHKQWRIHGKCHREDGPALEYSNGHKEWFLNGILHREDGPAIEYLNGHKEWFVHGQLHREDGPALEFANGDKSYYINHIKYSEEDYWKKVESLNFILEKSKKQLCNK